MNASGKLSARLWQLYLVSGKTLPLFKASCDNIRSLTTDMGVGRLLCDQPNCMRLFLEQAFPSERFGPYIYVGSFIFPKALFMPGWRHTFDGLIRRGMCSLPWFAGFLEKLRALVSFFRDLNLVSELARGLR